MELLTVTKDIATRAILFGACAVPKVGALISSFSVSDLSWAEKMFTRLEMKKFKLPLWALSGSGFGDGFGFGDVSGSGFGFGYGYGSGDGDGYGFGYGSGDGDGYGFGYGSGDGDGYSGYGDVEDICAKILALDAPEKESGK